MLDLVLREKLKPDKSREPLMLELDDFIRCIKGEKQPVVSGTDGLQALFVAGRIMKSIDESLQNAGLKGPSGPEKELKP